MTHLLTGEAELAAAALAAAYLDLAGTQAGKLLAAIAVQARNVGHLDRLSIGTATGKRVGLDRGETIRARNRLANIGWLKPDRTGPRSAWTLTRPSDPRPQPDALDSEIARLLADCEPTPEFLALMQAEAEATAELLRPLLAESEEFAAELLRIVAAEQIDLAPYLDPPDNHSASKPAATQSETERRRDA